MKEVTMNFRVDEALRDAFAEAAAQQNRPAAQIMRELMRNFVAQVRAGRPARDEATLAERRAAVDFARANDELEGYQTSPELADEFERYARGEIEIADMHRETERRFGHRIVKP